MNFTKKTLLCYTTGRPNTSKIILNFARGVNRQDDGWVAEVIEIDAFLKSGIPHHADAVMSLGILRGTGLLMQTAAEKRIDRYYMDHAYFDPGYDTTKQSWMRICKNRHTMNWLGGSDGSRWASQFKDTNLVTPWRNGQERGDGILVCPPTDAVGWYFNAREWEEQTVDYIKSVIPTKDHYKIRVRRKPGGPKVNDKGDLIGKEEGVQPKSFSDQLTTTNFVVAHNSMVALEAVRNGYPVVTDIHNCCYSISNSFDDIVDMNSKDERFDEEPNRRKLFYWLSDNQYTKKEISSGSAWLKVSNTEPPD